jgi:hypothetical protein
MGNTELDELVDNELQCSLIAKGGTGYVDGTKILYLPLSGIAHLG